jgi:hypothetical protein
MPPKSAVSVFLMAIMVAGIALSCFGAVNAESSISKPSVPEFTVSVTAHSYDIQTTTTTTTDPYDSHISTTTMPGYHVVNGSIEVSIKNQQFTPYYASNGYPIKLFYHFRAKGFDVNWHYSGEGAYVNRYFEATNSTYTTFAVLYSGNSFEISGGWNIYKSDGTLGFQVEAFIGYMNVTNINPADIMVRADDLRTDFVGETSGWSDTQTATIPNGAYTPVIATPLPTSPIQTASPITQSPDVTQTQPTIRLAIQVDWLEVGIFALLGVVAVLLVFVVVFLGRRSVK